MFSGFRQTGHGTPPMYDACVRLGLGFLVAETQTGFAGSALREARTSQMVSKH